MITRSIASRARRAITCLTVIASTTIASAGIEAQPAGADLGDDLAAVVTDTSGDCDPIRLLTEPATTGSSVLRLCSGVPIVRLPPGDGTRPVDLTLFDDMLDAVYVLVPSVHGTSLYLLDAVDTEMRDNVDEGTCDGANSAPDGYKVVWGGADPPQRFTEYRDSTGHAWSYVRGFATIRSCWEQQMIVKAQEEVGGSVTRDLMAWFIAPADRKVSAWSAPLDCDRSEPEEGFSYRSRVETAGTDGWTVNEPAWSNSSSSRYWPGC